LTKRPAWPKLIHVIDSIPLTTVGKDLQTEPSVRTAAKTTDHGFGTGIENWVLPDARVDVALGGARGMTRQL